MRSMRAARTAFAAFASSIAALAHADALMLDGNNQNIGLYTGILENNGSVVISSTGYRVVVQRATGRMNGPVDSSHEVLYSDNTFCTGQLYLDTTASQSYAVAEQYLGVLVPIIGGPSGLDLAAMYYVPQTATPVSTTLRGKFWQGPISGTQCTTITPFDGLVLPAYPNDPAVTGVPNSWFVPPLKVTRNDIFQSGFEPWPPLGAVESVAAWSAMASA